MTGLQALIGLRKGDRSYEQLSKACGGRPTAQQLQRLATSPPSSFPAPDTIRAMSRGLGVTETTIVLAAAESLGLDVRAPDGWAALLPAGIDRIPSHMRDSILSVVHSAVHMVKDEEVVTDGKPQPRRQEAQQAGSAPRIVAGDDEDDLPPVLTEEWVRDHGWAAHVVDPGDVETSGDTSGTDTSTR